MDVACGRILGQTADPRILAGLEEDADVEEYLELRPIPTVQGIMLGYTKGDLAAYLSISTAGIDDVDYQGRTALSWAAIKGDQTSLQILLGHGVDPNVRAFNLDAPLHYATRAPNHHCVAPLIAHGADINALNAWQVNPLCYANAFRDEIRYAAPLIDAGADLNLRDKHGRSAMIRAVHNNRLQLCQYLLENGADWIEADVWGYETFKISIENGFRAVTQVLLKRRVSLMPESEITTILEFATRLGDHNTVCTVKQMQLHLKRHILDDHDDVGNECSGNRNFIEVGRSPLHPLVLEGTDTSQDAEMDGPESLRGPSSLLSA